MSLASNNDIVNVLVKEKTEWNEEENVTNRAMVGDEETIFYNDKQVYHQMLSSIFVWSFHRVSL